MPVVLLPPPGVPATALLRVMLAELLKSLVVRPAQASVGLVATILGGAGARVELGVAAQVIHGGLQQASSSFFKN